MGSFWFLRGMAFLPVFLVIWTYLTFTISYIIAVSRGDVDAGFPYISDTGARRPESCIFGQMLNISAVAVLGCFYVRFKQVSTYLDKLDVDKRIKVDKINRVAFALSWLVSFGLSIVANFQETSVEVVHYIGAGFAFVLGTVYEFMHAYVTFKMHPEVNGKGVFYARLVISVMSGAALIGSFLSSVLSKQNGQKLHWKPEDKGYSAHLASTIMEWVLAGSFLSYFLTFIRDFQVISIRAETHLHHTTLYHVGGDQLREEEQGGENLT